MFKVTKYPHGTFSWIDCNTTDWEAGKKFYTELMGWTTEDIPMGEGLFYTMFKQDGLNVAGFSPMMPDMQAQGMPSAWNSYITVEDVDVLVPKVKQLGGTVIAGPMDVFESGRMVTIQDPGGAIVSLWQPKNHIGASLVNTPGALTWNELYSGDLDKARDFYTNLLGWEWQQMEEPNYYWTCKVNERMNGGAMQLTPDFGDMPPNWTVYLSIADIEATTQKVKDLGGQVLMELHDAGEVGRFSVILDPQGAAVTLIQVNNPESWIE